ncbi:MAG: hypothetical protein ACTSVV_18130 [Promethearchaeota archaeon]
MMAKKTIQRKKVDIRKKRKKIIQQKQKELSKKDLKIEKKKPKSEKEQKLEIRLKKETKLYWIRAITGVLSALVGRLFLGLVGWPMFFWMLAFWFGFPFFVSFIILRYPYDKEEWNWKNIIKPGIGIFFFMFMIVGIIVHTLLLFN